MRLSSISSILVRFTVNIIRDVPSSRMLQFWDLETTTRANEVYTCRPPLSLLSSINPSRNLRYYRGVSCERHVGNSLDAIRRGYGYFHANADISFFEPPTWNNSGRIRSRRNRASKLSGLMRKRPIAREYKHFLKRGQQGGVDSFTIEDFGVISPVNKIVHFAHRSANV